MKAPMKPTTAEMRHPPSEYPARDCPNMPATAAIASKMINPSKLIIVPPTVEWFTHVPFDKRSARKATGLA
jgi:hypothetical protein